MDDLKPFGYPVDWIKDARLLEVPERARNLLEEYSGISSKELMDHINGVVSDTPKLHDRIVMLTVAKRAKALETVRVTASLFYRLTFAFSIPIRA